MAKKQTFAEKVRKGQGGAIEKMVKVVVSYQSQTKGSWRFGEKIVTIPADANEKQIIADAIEKNRAELVARS